MVTDRGGPARETVGERLRRLRRERGLSQRELAGPGVSYAYISRIEAGTRQPSVKALRVLASKLGVSPEYLETGSETRDVDDRELRLTNAELALRLNDDAREAQAAFVDVLESASAAGDTRSATRARVGIGLVAHRIGDFARAIAELERATAEGAVAPSSRPDVYGILGRSYAAAGMLDRAIELFERCMRETAAQDPSNTTAYARYASNLSAALVDADELARAAAVLREAIERTGDSEDVYTRIRLYWSQARVAELGGHPIEALEYARRAIALLEATEDTQHLARAHVLVGWILVLEGEPAEALQHLGVAESLFGDSADATDLAYLRVEQARAHARAGDGAAAVENARAALDLIGDGSGAEGSAWGALAEGLGLENEMGKAFDAFERAVDLLSRNSWWREAAEAARSWARLLRAEGRDVDALDVLEKAADFAARAAATRAQLRVPRAAVE